MADFSMVILYNETPDHKVSIRNKKNPLRITERITLF
jgi:hypothetical protein